MVLYLHGGKWDMKFMQDYNFKVSGNKRIQSNLVLMLNIGNLILIWGVSVPTSVQPIGVSVDPTTKVPTYTLMERKKRSITMLVCCQDGKRNLD
jgi:hypothetical protein